MIRVGVWIWKYWSQYISAWMADPANNSIAPDSEIPAFDEPLVGCASGDDSVVCFYQG